LIHRQWGPFFCVTEFAQAIWRNILFCPVLFCFFLVKQNFSKLEPLQTQTNCTLNLYMGNEFVLSGLKRFSFFFHFLVFKFFLSPNSFFSVHINLTKQFFIFWCFHIALAYYKLECLLTWKKLVFYIFSSWDCFVFIAFHLFTSRFDEMFWDFVVEALVHEIMFLSNVNE